MRRWVGMGAGKQIPHCVPFDAQGERDDRRLSLRRILERREMGVRLFIGMVDYAAGSSVAFCGEALFFLPGRRVEGVHGDVVTVDKGGDGSVAVGAVDSRS